MIDAKGREIRYLRLSVTDRCNFRCTYCMSENEPVWLPKAGLLAYEEILSAVKVLARDLGVSKIRVTGGEPLLRRGVVEFIGELSRVPELAEVTLTTNGALFAPAAEALRRARVRRINFSLDTLRRDRFRAITGVDGLDQVLEGIEAARSAHFSPIKLNVVVLEETIDEAPDFVAYGIERGIEVRFIERLPGCGVQTHGAFVSNAEVERRLASRFHLAPIATTDGASGPAIRFEVNGGRAVCGFISPVSRPFCSGCNRLRLRSDGRLVPCLRGRTHYDLMPWIRPRLDAPGLAAAVRAVIAADPKEDASTGHAPPMSILGG